MCKNYGSTPSLCKNCRRTPSLPRNLRFVGVETTRPSSRQFTVTIFFQADRLLTSIFYLLGRKEFEESGAPKRENLATAVRASPGGCPQPKNLQPALNHHQSPVVGAPPGQLVGHFFEKNKTVALAANVRLVEVDISHHWV